MYVFVSTIKIVLSGCPAYSSVLSKYVGTALRRNHQTRSRTSILQTHASGEQASYSRHVRAENKLPTADTCERRTSILQHTCVSGEQASCRTHVWAENKHPTAHTCERRTSILQYTHVSWEQASYSTHMWAENMHPKNTHVSGEQASYSTHMRATNKHPTAHTWERWTSILQHTHESDEQASKHICMYMTEDTNLLAHRVPSCVASHA